MNRVDYSDVPAKIMLFGEYSIIEGSMAVTMPFFKHFGKLGFSDISTPKVKESNKSISNFFDSIISNNILTNEIDCSLLQDDISKGLFFDSIIPKSYGMGSSGALCAAVALDYSFPKSIFHSTDLTGIKKAFSVMESYFHGRSSGIDPLTSFLGKPLLFNSDLSIIYLESLNNSIDYQNVFLLDSGFQSSTAGLVDYFLESIKSSGYRRKIENDYIPLLNSTIQEFINCAPKLKSKLTKLSEMQLDIFNKMIPENMKGLWENGIATGDYCLKLCGSGGGGYLLGFKFSENMPFEYLSV